MRTVSLFFLLFLLALNGLTQIAPDHYLVEFTDKNGTPYSADHPEVYLSQKAIARRVKFNVMVSQQDFPVNPAYLKAVTDIGVKVVQQVKWLNSIVIKTADTAKLSMISSLPFVKKLVKNRLIPGRNTEPFPAKLLKVKTERGGSSIDYGESFSQISMLGGIPLHNKGFLGQGLSIAVLDGGFTGANFMKAFDSLRANGQIKGLLNLVGGGTWVYQGTTHGSHVLSILAANVPGVMVGTAPKADYYLIRSEDTNGESLLEEYNWVTGAAYADSAGVDIISSSLSYAISSDPTTEISFKQLDGNTAPVTLGAEIAVRKGMIVIVSAGNNGQNQFWPHVGFPADGDSVFAIGAVDAHGIRSPFSSPGPTYDGRIKPEVMAMGVGTSFMEPDGSVGTGDGTSFATPIIAGLTACLWQAYPLKSNMDVLSAIRMSGTRYSDPDTLMGNGVPDFSNADRILTVNNLAEKSRNIGISPNPFSDYFEVDHIPATVTRVDAEMVDVNGQVVYSKTNIPVSVGNGFIVRNISVLSKGFYWLKIKSGSDVYFVKTVKL